LNELGKEELMSFDRESVDINESLETEDRLGTKRLPNSTPLMLKKIGKQAPTQSLKSKEKSP